jgi:hypothetical protein
MFRGLFKLTWLEIKIFLREPMGAIGSILLPVLVFVGVGRFLGGRLPQGFSRRDDRPQRSVVAGHHHLHLP